MNVIRSSLLGKNISLALSNSQLILGGYFYSFTCANCAGHLLVVDLFKDCSSSICFLSSFSNGDVLVVVVVY